MSATTTTARRLPPVPADMRAAVNAALEPLAPAFRRALEAACDQVQRELGVRPRIFETLRTPERQRELYGFGRTWDEVPPRGIVTNSRDALDTWHGYGLAADVIHPTLLWAAPATFWSAIGEAARAHGLTWGGDWARFPDRPHVQWGRCRRSPSERARNLRRIGGDAAVWREVVAL